MQMSFSKQALMSTLKVRGSACGMAGPGTTFPARGQTGNSAADRQRRRAYLTLLPLSPEGRKCLQNLDSLSRTALTSGDIRDVTRRRLLGSAAASLLLLVSRNAAAPASVLAVRVWPARDYTRITLESREPLIFSHHSAHQPERLVVDLEGLELNSVLQSLPAKITGQDPYIQLIRAGRNRPGVVRLVIDPKDRGHSPLSL
jgi:hypothetical protein